MNERQSRLLAAIIDQFIRTAEPVGSKAIIEQGYFEVSGATIRNEMQFLSEQGLIEQPHVSAGRIPTAQGYRMYVREFMEPTQQEKTARQKFETLKEQYFQQKDQERVYDAVTVLSRMTPNICFATVPHREGVFYMGLANTLKQPEFSTDMTMATGIAEVLETHLQKVLSELSIDNSVRYFIGEEHLLSEMQSCSLIAISYTVREGTTGVLGILGPMRMDYAYNTVALQLAADMLVSY